MSASLDPRTTLDSPSIEIDPVATGRPEEEAAAPAAPAGPDPSDHLAVGIQVLRDLLRIETRPDRVRRVLRIWESKVSTAIRSRDLRAAEEWMKGLNGDRSIPAEHAAAVGSAFATMSRPALIDDLLVWMVDAEALDDGAGLLAEWGAPVVARMIDLMAVDDPPVNRRHMVDVLAAVGRSDTRLLTSHVSDHRWYIVRNVAIALGRSGRLAALPVLKSLLSHEDSRVRVEALRGLAAIDAEASMGDMVAAFRDVDRRVRQVAVSLLRACPSPEVVTRLVDAVTNGGLGAAEAQRLVEVIGERKDGAALAALETIASRRARPRAPKAARQAAKVQLARRAS